MRPLRNASRRSVAVRGPLLQRLCRPTLGPIVRFLWPSETSGLEFVPATGPAILCANHLSFMDSVLLMVLAPRPVHFIGKAEYLTSWKTRRLFPAMGMIPVDRESGQRALIALDAAGVVLADGGVLALYPEGTRSRDGRLYRGYTGAARLALAHGCPILPVGIVGTDAIQPAGARFPRPRRHSRITIADAITVERMMPVGRVAARALTEQVMTSIGAMTGQTMVAHYAPRVVAPLGMTAAEVAVPVSVGWRTWARRVARQPLLVLRAVG